MKYAMQLKAILKDGPMPWSRIKPFVVDPPAAADELMQLVARGDVVRGSDGQFDLRGDPATRIAKEVV